MKKGRKWLLLFLAAALAVGLWFYGYYSRKSNDNIPAKDLMVSYYLEKGEEYATGKLLGYRNTQLHQVWGEPDGHLSGFFGEIWEAEHPYYIIVYYDNEAVVERVKVMAD